MRSVVRPYLMGMLSVAMIAAPAVTAVAQPAAVSTPATRAAATGAAPGAPGTAVGFLPSTKSGFGTAYNRTSKIWFTTQREGGLGEIFYPNLSSPSARALGFVVADQHGSAVRASDAADVR